MKTNIRKISVAAMFAALAYTLAAISNFVPIALVPSLPFLNYDPKDVIITIAAFVLGPLYALPISLISAVVEMPTVSSTGAIGMIMNFLSSSIFAGTAALIYRRKRDVIGAIIGLCCSSLVTTAFMLGWNYIVSPYYMGVTREAIAEMLIPGFLPFNLIKSALNSGIILVVYKPIVNALRGLKLIDKKPSADSLNNERKEISSARCISIIAGIILLLVAVAAVYLMYQK